MKEIKVFEEAIKQNARNLKELGINKTLFCAYETSKRIGNELIDFKEVIWDYDIEEIVQTLRANDITEFTISSTFSNLIKVLAAFEKQGISMAGLTTVNSCCIDYNTGKLARIPAIKLVMKESEEE